MRLLQKTNRYYLFISLILFLLIGLILYILLLLINRKAIDEKLHETRIQVTEHLYKKQSIPNLYPVVQVTTVSAAGLPERKDTLIYDPVDKEYEKYKVEVFYENINDTWYKITLRRSLKENRALMLAITFSIIIILIFLFISLFLLNRYISKKIWTSFYHNLKIIRHFSLTLDPSPIHLQKSNIQEFNELNQAIENLSSKVISDYRVLREFTENASHETQTPLAVIISKLEMMLQQGDLTDQQVKEIYSVYQAAKRLSGLNQNLLLLSRIEHELFPDNEPVRLDKIILDQLNDLSGLAESKKLTISFQPPETPCIITGNSYLTGILVSNLLKNAMIHNTDNGKIRITLSEKFLLIENTGRLPDVEPEKLFERFRKANSSSRSAGLGLAIVKQICQTFHWQIFYTYSDGIHSLKILF